MKHIDLFNQFLLDTVNLNDTRIQELETRTEAIKNAIRASEWGPHLRGWERQGSWAHQTIIKPVDQGEFDADLLVFVNPVDNWSATQYIDKLFDALRANGTYRHKVKRWSHCVTITYANEMKVDVAPCIVDRGGIKRLEVCNRDTNQFERTEPLEYTNWLVRQNGYSGSNSFRKVTRLVKYLRDIKTRFTSPSMLLTTILGYRIGPADKGSAEFADVPTAFKTVFTRMDDWLQLSPSKPVVRNPYLASENFADAWTDEQYSTFRDKIHEYRDWIEDAFDEQDRAQSISKWRRLFGEDFALGAVVAEARGAGNVVVSEARRWVNQAANFTGDLVDAIGRFGANILPAAFNRQPHMVAPTWKRAPAIQQMNVFVSSHLHRSKYGTQPIREVRSLDPLQPGKYLHFRATNNAGITFSPNDFKVMWRITNTDEAAAQARQLRGGFENPEADNGRWEHLLYRGVHLVEAFVIRKRDNLIVGQSDAFRVMIM